MSGMSATVGRVTPAVAGVARHTKPILFSAPMVRALLAGTKTQTRRIVKGAPDCPQGWYPDAYNKTSEWTFWGTGVLNSGKCTLPFFKNKFGQIGDRLWVRETWAMGILHYGIVYAADGGDVAQRRIVNKWNPSIFMPRWASRITLEIIGVRVERLQDISEADALAEGVGGSATIIPCFAVERYRQLWESINGPGSWNANPWVWVIEFKVVTP